MNSASAQAAPPTGSRTPLRCAPHFKIGRTSPSPPSTYRREVEKLAGGTNKAPYKARGPARDAGPRARPGGAPRGSVRVFCCSHHRFRRVSAERAVTSHCPGRCARRSPALPRCLLSPGDLSAAALLLGDAAQAAAGALPQAPSKVAFEPRGITTQDSVVFVIGVIPFVWATYEFWRRIAVGEPFGTTKDGSVVIAPEPDKVTGQPRRLLGRGAITLAYILFAAVGCMPHPRRPRPAPPRPAPPRPAARSRPAMAGRLPQAAEVSGGGGQVFRSRWWGWRCSTRPSERGEGGRGGVRGGGWGWGGGVRARAGC